MRKTLDVDYFFLENVKMDKTSENIISECLGVEPVLVNSALVSAQNRERLYWTNIPGFEQPMDRRIITSDILDTGYRKTKLYTENDLQYDAKSYSRCINVGHDFSTKYEQIQRVYSKNAKCPTLDTKQGGNRSTKISHSPGRFIELNTNELERLQGLPDNYTSNVSKSAAHFGIGNGWNVDTVMEFFKHLPKS